MASPVGGCSPEEFAALVVAFGNNADLATSLCGKLGSANLVDVSEGLNTQFLLFAGALVFIMHGGFAMVSAPIKPAASVNRGAARARVLTPPPPAPPQLCAGAIRSKNTMNILLQTILDASVSALAFYLVG
jgi:Amt family ammonium transporter